MQDMNLPFCTQKYLVMFICIQYIMDITCAFELQFKTLLEKNIEGKNLTDISKGLTSYSLLQNFSLNQLDAIYYRS